MADTDTDADGVADCLDVCPGGDDNVDTDGDGVADFCDICPGGDDTVEPPPPTQVAVNGAVAWSDTGVDVATGDEVDVTATGMVFHNPQDSIGPDGVRGIAELQGPLGSDHHAGLIGRITDAGAPFLVGEQATFVAEQDGRLYLGINDADLSTNSGAFDATVTVTPG